MSDNGNSLVKMREILKESADAAVAEPVKAAPVPLTAQQRAERCQSIIQDALNEYGCGLVGSLEEYAPNRFLRSTSVQIVVNTEA